MLPLIAALLVAQVAAQGEADLVNMPGLTFKTNFKTYSGFLNANDKGTWRMHYFLTESQSDPDNDPLLLWFNGGPGCSSMGGMFEELGPFYVNYDGQTLFENVYAWNKKANVLALESPIGVGFSYDTEVPNSYVANDDRSAQQNYQALADFFNRVQPKYKNRTFFVSGESYAGIYIPMLSKLLVEGINNGTFPNKNFQGAAIGNGFMHVQKLFNSLVLWSAYHGRISPSDWEKAKKVCRTGTETDPDKYNYQQFMWTTNGMDYYADNTTDCGLLLEPLITDDPGNLGLDFDQYNFYQDCYEMPSSSGGQKRRFMGGYTSLGPNTATLTNYDSTDNQWGYPCWNGGAYRKYLNRKEVQDALHIEPGWAAQGNNTRFTGCNDPMYENYNLTYPNMRQFFDYVIANVTTPGFRFLVYNGDTDTVCNYLGDGWFIEEIANDYGVASGSRVPWTFAKQMGGMWQSYAFKNLKIDVLTVKGAGHMVPNDRPGPSLQMITNFMFPFGAGSDYSSEKFVKPTPVVSDLLPTANTNTTSTTTTATTTTTGAAAGISLILAFFAGFAQL